MHYNSVTKLKKKEMVEIDSALDAACFLMFVVSTVNEVETYRCDR